MKSDLYCGVHVAGGVTASRSWPSSPIRKRAAAPSACPRGASGFGRCASVYQICFNKTPTTRPCRRLAFAENGGAFLVSTRHDLIQNLTDPPSLLSTGCFLTRSRRSNPR